jgi:hypothetical protein
LDSQFRCGKCAKPVSSKYAKCLDCGSLGPHIFSGSGGSAIEGGPAVAGPHHRRDSYPSDRIEHQQPPPPRQDRFSAPEAMETTPEPPRSHMHETEDDSRFPAGMRSRSPILDFVEDMDESREKEPRRHSEREADRDSMEQSETHNHHVSYEGDRDETAAPSESSSNTVTYIVSAILILVLIIAALYVYNNFDSLTTWLASPTIPEVFRPSR